MSAGVKECAAIGRGNGRWSIPMLTLIVFAKGAGAEMIIEVHQLVRDLKGNLLADKMVGHIFRIENGLVKRFDIRGE